MSDCQEFPNTWEEFEQLYGFEDKKEIYTNGSRLIQSFRVKQWLDHTAEPERKTGKWEERKVYSMTIMDYQSAKCSVCGKYLTTPYLYSFDNYPFCPSCGADMRGENGKA